MVARHEVGHALGIFDHPNFAGLMGSGETNELIKVGELSQREENLYNVLYKLPHGSKVEIQVIEGKKIATYRVVF